MRIVIAAVTCLLTAFPDTSKLSKEKKLLNPKYQKTESIKLKSNFKMHNIKKYKEVSVTVVDERFVPVRHFVIKDYSGNSISWDYLDQNGKEVPSGEYIIIVSITYLDDSKETKYIRVNK